MELYRDLCRYWKDTILIRLGKMEGEAWLKQIDNYLKTIIFYDDIEKEIPNWLEKEMGTFFKQLEELHLE